MRGVLFALSEIRTLLRQSLHHAPHAVHGHHGAVLQPAGGVGGLVAVNDLSMHIDHQEIVALIGPHGAGKTTAFNMITGVYTPTSGSVTLNSCSITGLRPDRIAHAGIARTFQNIRLFKALTVLDNVLIAQHLRLTASWPAAVLRTPCAM